jgi:prepilin-type processing-associated H-X9-DG protein
MGTLGTLVVLTLPAIQSGREAAREGRCQKNLMSLAFATLSYQLTNKVFPNGMTFDPALAVSVQTLTKYGPNWIIDVLPYMGQEALHDSFDLSRQINGPAANNPNYNPRGTVLEELLCSSDGYNKVRYQGHGGNWARTNYAANAGREFIYGSYFSGKTYTPWSDHCRRGVMGPNAQVKLKQITDGASKTIMLGEVRAGLTISDGRGVWALGHAGASLLAKYGAGSDDNGPNNCDPRGDDVYSDLCATGAGICSASGANPIAQAQCMSCFGGAAFDQATTRSAHGGGVYVAMCDGSVKFVSDDVETSGCYGSCCSVWDWMIASGDNGRGGPFNGVVRNGCQ